MLEKALESPLDCKEIKLVNPEENQLWIFIGRTDAETEAPILWLPDAKSQFIGKDPDAGKDWGHEEKGATEDKMVGWHHQLNGHEVAEAHGVEKIWTWLSNWTTIEKETINKMKQPPTEWEKILVNNMSDKRFTLKNAQIIHTSWIPKKTNSPIKRWT